MNASALSLKEQLTSKLPQLEALLLLNGVTPSHAAAASIRKFTNSSETKQEQILKNISAYLDILSQTPEPASRRINPRTEIARLHNAIRAFNLRAIDESIFDMIHEDDVVEVYSDDGIQLYRNVNFCKLCSYNLLDLAVNSWSELYEKPSSASEQIQSRIETVLTTDVLTTPYDIGTFIQREKFIFAQTLRTFLVTPKFLSPLVDNISGRRGAFISTYSASILTEGDSLKLDII